MATTANTHPKTSQATSMAFILAATKFSTLVLAALPPASKIIMSCHWWNIHSNVSHSSLPLSSVSRRYCSNHLTCRLPDNTDNTSIDRNVWCSVMVIKYMSTLSHIILNFVNCLADCFPACLHTAPTFRIS